MEETNKYGFPMKMKNWLNILLCDNGFKSKGIFTSRKVVRGKTFKLWI